MMIDVIEATLPSIAHGKGSFAAVFQRFIPRGGKSAFRCANAPLTERPGLKPYEVG